MSSYVRVVADGATDIFTVPSRYLSKTHIRVQRNGINMLSPGDFEWINDTQIKFRVMPPEGTLIENRRVTPDSTSLVTFHNGAVLTANDLNVAALQSLLRAEELQDQFDGYLTTALIRYANGGSAGALTPEQMIAAIAQEVLNSQLVHDLQERIGDIDVNAESILSQTIRVNELQEIVESLADIDGTGITTFIINEQEQRIAGDTALAGDLSLIGAKSGDGLGWVLNTSTVRVSPGESLATRLSSIASTLAANAAAITSEASTRVTETTALASSITALGTTVSNNYSTLSSAISSEASTRSSGDATNATAITNLASTVSNNLTTVNAAISSEASTRASGDSANASAITTLQGTVSGVSASLSTLATVVNGPSGLAAQYMVKTDVNGRVAGFGLYNSGTVSEFAILANKFSIVDPGSPGSTPKVPFAVSGGVVYMQNVVIADALIQNLTITKLTTGSLNADMQMGTGRIIFSNGSRMLVEGTGFGSSNQFILWFGPHSTNLATCTEGTATMFLKTNGQAYFGGALSTGTYRNAGTGSLLTSAADFELGPFGTLGNPITVSFSYVLHGEDTLIYPATVSTQSPTATIWLSRSIGGAAYVDVASISAGGGYQYEPATPSDNGRYQQDMSGSGTYTDTAGGLGARKFKLRITARNNVNSTVTQQLLTIATQEN